MAESLSISQFSELLGIEGRPFVSVQVDRAASSVTVIFEDDMAQTSGTFPELKTGKKKGKGK